MAAQDETRQRRGAGAQLGAARRLELARSLTALREAAGLTQAELANLAGVAASSVRRHERWRDTAGVVWRTVRDLASAAGARPAEVERLVQLARSEGDGWWARHAAVPDWLDPLIAVEDWATWERAVAVSYVPGLLQSEAYSRATHQAQQPPRSPGEIEEQVDARARRQRVLTREAAPLRLHAILDEAVLHRAVGGRAVMAGQLAHLLEVGEQLENVTIQVLPYAAGAAGANGHFVLLGRARSAAVAYVELRGGGLYLDAPHDLDAHRAAFAELRRAAATPARSRALIDRLRLEYLT